MRARWLPVLALLVLGCTPARPLGSTPSARPPAPTPGSCQYRVRPAGVLPDPLCTPGVADPNVTPATIAQTICRIGYTQRVRPPSSYTNALKHQQMALYGDLDPTGQLLDPSNYEEDHLLPLELGGAPRDPRNLWPEPDAGAKDRVENRLHALVCGRTLDLLAAQQRILVDWTTALEGLP